MDLFEKERKLDINQRLAEEYNVLPEDIRNGSQERTLNAFFTGTIIVTLGAFIIGTPLNPIPWIIGGIVFLGHRIISGNSHQAKNEQAARERLQSIRRVA